MKREKEGGEEGKQEEKGERRRREVCWTRKGCPEPLPEVRAVLLGMESRLCGTSAILSMSSTVCITIPEAGHHTFLSRT